MDSFFFAFFTGPFCTADFFYPLHYTVYKVWKEFTIKKYFFIYLIGLVFSAVSCKTIDMNPLDITESNYLAVRTISQKIVPAIAVVMQDVEEITIFGEYGVIPARVYRPLIIRENAPVLMYIHGGGYVIGSYNQTDLATRLLAIDGQCIVISIEYHLAPEFPYPAAVKDSVTCFKWICDNADEFGITPDRIAVAGESAGGALSAIVSQYTRDNNMQQPLAQILFSPLTGRKNENGEIWPSRIRNKISILTETSLDTFLRLYLGDDLQGIDSDPYISPLYAASFKNLPQALVITCGLDPLADEGQAYAAKMAQAGVSVQKKHLKYRDHAYLGVESIRAAGKFLRRL